jgi:hypothetical protein
VVNLIFMMVVYVTILDIAQYFGANKTSLDFFAAWVVVIALLFGDVVCVDLDACWA